MEEHLSRVESLLTQVELEMYEIKKQLKSPATLPTQELILRHLKEKIEAALARYQRLYQLTYTPDTPDFVSINRTWAFDHNKSNPGLLHLPGAGLRRNNRN